MNVALGSPVREIRTPGSTGGGRHKEEHRRGCPLPDTHVDATRRWDPFRRRSSNGGGGSGQKSSAGMVARNLSVQQGARIAQDRFHQGRQASGSPPPGSRRHARGRPTERSRPCCPRAAPHSMKTAVVVEVTIAAGAERSHILWCREPVEKSDPGDPEHHRLLPPSGEHAEESPSITDRREPLQGG